MSCIAWIELTCVAVLTACGTDHRSAADDGGDGSGTDAAGCMDPAGTGCACAPLAPGTTQTVTTHYAIRKLVADPARCAIYGLADNVVVVYDTQSKTEVATIPYTGDGIDFDIDRLGTQLVVANRTATAGTFDLIDLASRQVVQTVPAQVQPGRVELAASGVIYYINFDQFSSVRRYDPATLTDLELGAQVAYQADIELVDDDSLLLVGDSSSSSCAVTSYDVHDPGFAKVGRSHWDRNFDFSNAPRRLLASHAGNTYYARHQFKTAALAVVTGGTHDEDILAESDDGGIAIGTEYAFDAALSTPTTILPAQLTAAAFAASGQEAWLYDGGMFHLRATADLYGPRPLGVREVAPDPLVTYAFEQLLVDVPRGVLYARDPNRDVVVVIDATTLSPTRAIRVGTAPSDMALDPDGTALYVGHAEMEALARVDLTTTSFDRFLETPRRPFEVEPAGVGRVIVADQRDDSAPTLFTIATGTASATTQLIGAAALTTSADGTKLFAGESNLGSDMFELVIGSASLSLVRRTNGGLSPMTRVAVANPLGTTVYFANQALDAQDLTVSHFTTLGPVRAVSPDGRLVVDAQRITNAMTGADLGAVPVFTNVMAIGGTDLYLWANGAITRVSLAGY